MRSEREMMEAILGFASEDERIRAALLSGSRTNPAARRDIFQDYDVVFVVASVDGFVRDRSWIAERFGETIVMQTPDEFGERPWEPGECFGFLMLFADGNRIDLTFYPAARLGEFKPDSLSVVLLDKDGRFGPLPPPSDRDYREAPPTAERFAQCCNEFWWVSTYVAKGLWRRELAYAKIMFEGPVRDMLVLALGWRIGLRTGWSADAGKCGKSLERHLEPAEWEAFERTYADADIGRCWEALFAACGLFRETATELARRCGLEYPAADDRRVTAYLKRVRELPANAEAVY